MHLEDYYKIMHLEEFNSSQDWIDRVQVDLKETMRSFFIRLIESFDGFGIDRLQLRI